VLFVQAKIQAYIVHLMCNSLSFCHWKEHKAVAAELKGTCGVQTAELAAKRLEDFEQGP